MNCALNKLDALPRDVAVADDSAMAAGAELEDWAVDFAFALLLAFIFAVSLSLSLSPFSCSLRFRVVVKSGAQPPFLSPQN